MLVLAVSDRVSESLYSDPDPTRDPRLDAIISCGDLPREYLDFLVSKFNAPLFFVRGNHSTTIESGSEGDVRTRPVGHNLHLKPARCGNITLAGVQGCIRYNRGNYQYSQGEMWLHAIYLIPGLLANRLRFGRFLDVLVTHAPPWGINDQPDPAHQGVKAFRWLIRTFKPRFHFHGHVHLYKPSIPSEQLFGQTRVINTYGHHYFEI